MLPPEVIRLVEPSGVPDRPSRRGLNEFSRRGLNKFFAVGDFRALTSFVREICDALTLTSSHKKRFPTPSPLLVSVSELVQAQGYPVVRLGRVHIGWLDKASFGPGYEPDSHG
ncbi:hypothetical protein K469DRAFT_686550 [Zopfia rhizophila CBS 207.26]|uniref:Uncharacterized protein n=1 Tax=Zopfia rhizophila CBS 207.26 TaxID=1314779 RepID=A0A6A6ETA1_9PEZI|nr:hypothetical protein K469DRAFT_686550 [Zopfia rhizophila CBS 207.26]